MHFIIDTGSERTVIFGASWRTRSTSARAATVTVHSMTEVSRIPTVIVSGAQGRPADDGRHPRAPLFRAGNLGAPGILGVDTLQTQRVVFDFDRQEMTIMPSRRADPRWPEGEIVITARSRFGRLMLIDAEVDGQRVYVIVDTGSQITIGNEAFRRALERRHRPGPTAPMHDGERHRRPHHRGI